MELQEAWQVIREAFEAAGVDDAGLEAMLLVEHVTGLGRVDRITRPTVMLGPEQLETLNALATRRIAGEPVFRIIGKREFYGLELELSPETLEPRPDTEILAERVIRLAKDVVGRQGKCSILDIGTGTGAIALAVLANVPEAQATGSDISRQALETACRNAALHGLEKRFRVVHSDWFSKISGRFDVIVSNPPYIRTADIETLAPEVRDHDPRAALDGGADGLDAYRRLAAGCRNFIAKSGHIALETGFDQKDDVSALFAKGGYRLVASARDLGGNDRVLVFAL
jgi:release factor glutamine methyltransferase